MFLSRQILNKCYYRFFFFFYFDVLCNVVWFFFYLSIVFALFNLTIIFEFWLITNIINDDLIWRHVYLDYFIFVVFTEYIFKFYIINLNVVKFFSFSNLKFYITLFINKFIFLVLATWNFCCIPFPYVDLNEWFTTLKIWRKHLIYKQIKNEFKKSIILV
jgi:hypothetical protein